mgnify:CR=1 FL=1
MGRKRLGINRICAVCGAEFYKPPSHTAKWPALTCSRTCAARHFRDRGAFVDCAHCGESFYPQPNQVRKGYGNYCSLACFHATRREPPIECTCLQCRQTFSVTKWQATQVAGGGRYCSRKCQMLYKRKLVKRGERNMFTEWQKREWKLSACEKCGSTEKLELDHKVPRFAGGTTERSNAQTLCRKCNRIKFRTDDQPLYAAYLRQRAEIQR